MTTKVRHDQIIFMITNRLLSYKSNLFFNWISTSSGQSIQSKQNQTCHTGKYFKRQGHLQLFLGGKWQVISFLCYVFSKTSPLQRHYQVETTYSCVLTVLYGPNRHMFPRAFKDTHEEPAATLRNDLSTWYSSFAFSSFHFLENLTTNTSS